MNIERIKVWIKAMRPRTLPLALACILLGAFLAGADGLFDIWVTGLSVLTAVFLQILSNLANDYGDSLHGADHIEREGPQRAVQSGLITAQSMKRAMLLFGLLAVVTGFALLWAAFGVTAIGLFLLFAVLGAGSIWAAINYTAGGSPYGYAGLGDLFVLIFFGWVGVLGTYFLQAGQLPGVLWLPATSCGILAVAVLNVNNIRDIESDRKAGKISVPVRLGPVNARRYHWLLLSSGFSLALLYVLLQFSSLWQLLFILTTPLLVRNGTAVSRLTDPAAINPYLKQMAITSLLFNLLLGLGQIL